MRLCIHALNAGFTAAAHVLHPTAAVAAAAAISTGPAAVATTTAAAVPAAVAAAAVAAAATAAYALLWDAAPCFDGAAASNVCKRNTDTTHTSVCDDLANGQLCLTVQMQFPSNRRA